MNEDSLLEDSREIEEEPEEGFSWEGIRDLTDDIICVLCGGELRYLGILGRRVHLRCSNCGIDISKEI